MLVVPAVAFSSHHADYLSALCRCPAFVAKPFLHPIYPVISGPSSSVILTRSRVLFADAARASPLLPPQHGGGVPVHVRVAAAGLLRRPRQGEGEDRVNSRPKRCGQDDRNIATGERGPGMCKHTNGSIRVGMNRNRVPHAAVAVACARAHLPEAGTTGEACTRYCSPELHAVRITEAGQIIEADRGEPLPLPRSPESMSAPLQPPCGPTKRSRHATSTAASWPAFE
eukprot:2252566-Rhodomonas_salina.1